MTPTWSQLYNRDFLLVRGLRWMQHFCEQNNLAIPEFIRVSERQMPAGVCGYYRPLPTPRIVICLERCANVGLSGMGWSWPGHMVDRTPFGVVLHELGHHADCALGPAEGPWYSTQSRDMRNAVQEDPVSSYLGPTDEEGVEDPVSGCGEWYAEMFRLFAGNPDLLKRIRPKTFEAIVASGLQPIEMRPWEEVVKDAPERTIALLRKRVADAEAAPVPSASQLRLF